MVVVDPLSGLVAQPRRVVPPAQSGTVELGGGWAEWFHFGVVVVSGWITGEWFVQWYVVVGALVIVGFISVTNLTMVIHLVIMGVGCHTTIMVIMGVGCHTTIEMVIVWAGCHTTIKMVIMGVGCHTTLKLVIMGVGYHTTI